MTTFEALVLGVVQGVTEFLPISSTAHLRIVPALAGWGDPGAAFTAVLQLGTLVAVVGYFLPDLLRMLRAALGGGHAIARVRPSRPRASWSTSSSGRCRSASRASCSSTRSKDRCDRCG